MAVKSEVSRCKEMMIENRELLGLVPQKVEELNSLLSSIHTIALTLFTEYGVQLLLVNAFDDDSGDMPNP